MEDVDTLLLIAAKAIDNAIIEIVKQHPYMEICMNDFIGSIDRYANIFIKDKLHEPSKEKMAESYNVIHSSGTTSGIVFPINDDGDFHIILEHNSNIFMIYFKNDQPRIISIRDDIVKDSAYNYKTERIRYARGIVKSTIYIIYKMQNYTNTNFDPCETGVKQIFCELYDEIYNSFDNFFIKN